MATAKQALCLQKGDQVIINNSPCEVEALDVTTGVVTFTARRVVLPHLLYSHACCVHEYVPVDPETQGAEDAQGVMVTLFTADTQPAACPNTL